MTPKKSTEPTPLHPKLDAEGSAKPEEDVDHGLGSYVIPLPAGSKQVGTISALEAVELRARNKVIAALQDRIQLHQQTLTIVRNEKTTYMHGLIGKFGLTPRDDFEINDEIGAVYHKGRLRYVVPREAPPDPIVEQDEAPAEAAADPE